MSWIVAALCVLQAPAETVEPQDPDRPAYPAADLKALRESNVFSPRRSGGSSSSSGRREERRSETRSEPTPVRPKPIQVTGFVLDPATKTPRAILEDRNDEKLRALKEPLFAKPGDEAAGWTLNETSGGNLLIESSDTDGQDHVLKATVNTSGTAYISRSFTLTNGVTYTARARIKNDQERGFDSFSRLTWSPGSGVSENDGVWTELPVNTTGTGASVELRVGRFGGGLSPTTCPTRRERSASAGDPGNKDAVCASSPIPSTSTSKLSGSSASYARAGPS
jgi:hypothetical protein